MPGYSRPPDAFGFRKNKIPGPGRMESTAPVIWEEEGTVLVACPYCENLHKHAGVKSDVFRSSHCGKGEYKISLTTRIDATDMLIGYRLNMKRKASKRVKNAKSEQSSSCSLPA